LEARKVDLLRTEVGKPAPPFALESEGGSLYTLGDFRNKVVYLDLWASWCGSCREEIPSLKMLHDKYRNNQQVAIVSIAVNDRFADWKKAVASDKPGWLQLFDREGMVARQYFANLIPQFVLIDKMGNIIEFNAPWPSTGKEIENLIDKAVAQ
jgi:thiol-disulfide isomerase/thioredoxin